MTDSEVEKARSAVQNVPVRGMAAKIRQMMPDIIDRLNLGASYADISTALQTAGINIPAQTLKTYVYRYKKRPAPRHQAEAEGNRHTSQVSAPALPADTSPPQTTQEKLSAVLDPAQRDKLGDKYVNLQAPLFGKGPTKK